MPRAVIDVKPSISSPLIITLKSLACLFPFNNKPWNLVGFASIALSETIVLWPRPQLVTADLSIPKLQRCKVEDKEWISNIIPHSGMWLLIHSGIKVKKYFSERGHWSFERGPSTCTNTCIQFYTNVWIQSASVSVSLNETDGLKKFKEIAEML